MENHSSDDQFSKLNKRLNINKSTIPKIIATNHNFIANLFLIANYFQTFIITKKIMKLTQQSTILN